VSQIYVGAPPYRRRSGAGGP